MTSTCPAPSGNGSAPCRLTLGLGAAAGCRPASASHCGGSCAEPRAGRLHPASIIDSQSVKTTATRDLPLKEVVQARGTWPLHRVRHGPAADFAIRPGRWIVERTFAWPDRHRRLSKGYEGRVDFLRSLDPQHHGPTQADATHLGLTALSKHPLSTRCAVEE